MNMSTSKTGKHGGAKIHLTAIDIFTGRKYEEIFSSTENIDVPIVAKGEYQVSLSLSLSANEQGNDTLCHATTYS
jgi:translation elongation factor P/translation initiation factor 5A